jgi:hypothetical protein
MDTTYNLSGLPGRSVQGIASAVVQHASKESADSGVPVRYTNSAVIHIKVPLSFMRPFFDYMRAAWSAMTLCLPVQAERSQCDEAIWRLSACLIRCLLCAPAPNE